MSKWYYSHVVHNDALVKNRLYIQRWSYKITVQLKNSCHLVMLQLVGNIVANTSLSCLC